MVNFCNKSERERERERKREREIVDMITSVFRRSTCHSRKFYFTPTKKNLVTYQKKTGYAGEYPHPLNATNNWQNQDNSTEVIGMSSFDSFFVWPKTPSFAPVVQTHEGLSCTFTRRKPIPETSFSPSVWTALQQFARQVFDLLYVNDICS